MNTNMTPARAAQTLAADNRRERAAELLANGNNITQTAAALGVSPATVYRYYRDPEFRAAVVSARGNEFAPAAKRLRDEVPASIAKLVQLRDSEESAPTIQLKASIAIIELACKLTELEAINPRLEALELAASELRTAAGPQAAYEVTPTTEAT
jgi:AcrR family transcriptional regulator